MKEGGIFDNALKITGYFLMRKISKNITRTGEANLPTKFGKFKIFAYKTKHIPRGEHIALTLGNIRAETPVLTRIHSRCLTGDVFGSLRCDCGEQLVLSLEKISERGRGIVIYLDQEGRGIGLSNKIRAYALQDRGFDTVSANEHLGFAADERDFQIAAEILTDLEISEVDLLTNNPRKIESLRQAGILVKKRIPLQVRSNPHNYNYLLTKKQRLNHILCLPEL